MFNRRSLVLGGLTFGMAAHASNAQESADEYTPFEFNDIFSGSKGPVSDNDPNDLVKVGIIVGDAPRTDHVAVMEYLAGLGENPLIGDNARGSTGELFNTRWRKIANPLLVKFFHDVGIKKTPMAGDCTPWCAATVSWSLKRAGRTLPKDPGSSQSFLQNYGHKVNFPKETPVRGDICVFTDVDDSSHGHVGLWKGFAADGKKVRLLAGNQDGLGATECPAGYPSSRIDERLFTLNVSKNKKVSTLYFNAFVRPPKI